MNSVLEDEIQLSHCADTMFEQEIPELRPLQSKTLEQKRFDLGQRNEFGRGQGSRYGPFCAAVSLCPP
jgi:hypothetical protein